MSASPGKALIIGARGQDGRLLADALSADGWRIDGLDINGLTRADGAVEPGVDLTDGAGVAELIERADPDRIFYLAAHHASTELRDAEDAVITFEKSVAINFLGVSRVLAALARSRRPRRLCYAASSLVFGAPDHEPQTEATPFRPLNAYAVSKVAGVEACRLFRRAHGVFASVAILYNHKSPLRAADFVSQKIATAAARAAEGDASPLELRDVWATADWGAAEDYVRAMAAMLELPESDDFIVASGLKHTVADMAEAAFGHVGLDWREHVTSKAAPTAERPKIAVVGDATRLRNRSGWAPRVTFEAMIGGMVDAARTRIRSGR